MYIIVMPSGRSKKFIIARSAIGSARYQSVAECTSLDVAEMITQQLNDIVSGSVPAGVSGSAGTTPKLATKGGRKAA